MRPAAPALTAFEVAVGGRRRTLPGGHRVRIHAQAHRAAGTAPLRAGGSEHRVQPFGLGLRLDRHGARYDQHPHPVGDPLVAQHLGRRPHAPKDADWDDAVAYWRSLRTDDDATFGTEVQLDAADITPYVTWGTNPAQ